jgi:serine/threonine-protein kinase RsbT
MPVLKDQEVNLSSPEDVVLVRKEVRQWAIEIGFGLVDQTKLVTAASELARNAVIYGGGGIARIESVVEGNRRGIRVSFEDNGPGIADIDQAMKDGYTTGGGLGLGLGGAKRLTDEFEIDSKLGSGTRIRFTRWR